MRLISFSLLLVSSLFFWQGCKTTKHTIEEYKGNYLVFGSGGGFTGMVKEYWVLPNGQLFKGNGGAHPMEEKKLKRRKIKKLFKKAEKMGLLQTEYNKPGNMYYFIKYKKGEEAVELVWGREQQLLNSSLDSLYNEFMQLLPKPKTTTSTTNR